MAQKHKNAARDMKNSWKSFVYFWNFSKFANANFGEEGAKSLGSILHDRLTSFDLAKSGKFNNRCQNEFSQASLVPSTEGTDCFTIFVTPGVFQNLARQMWKSWDAALLLFWPSSMIENF